MGRVIKNRWYRWYIPIKRYSSHCIRGLALATQPFQVRFREAENLRDNKNRHRTQIKEITRYAHAVEL